MFDLNLLTELFYQNLHILNFVGGIVAALYVVTVAAFTTGALVIVTMLGYLVLREQDDWTFNPWVVYTGD